MKLKQHAGLRRSRIALASRAALCSAALAVSVATSSAWSQVSGPGSTVTISVSMNQWLGTASSSWSDVANWKWGGLFGLPDPLMPVHIGPVQQLLNGFPVGFDLPAREAVLDTSFSTPSLTIVAWDGLSQLRLAAGGLLDTNATVGGTHPAYTPSGSILPATLVLDGGNTAGSWSFIDHSRVVVNGQYGMPGGSWYGTLDNLTVTAGSTFTTPGSLAVRSLTNAGTLSVDSGSYWNVSGTLNSSGTFTVAGGSSSNYTHLYLDADTSLSGTGTTVLSSPASGYQAMISGAGGTTTLTIGAGHTLRGAGYVGQADLGIVNLGTVIAEGDTPLYLYPSAGQSFDNSAGRVLIAEGATLNLLSGTFSGGTVGVLPASTTGNSALGKLSFRPMTASGTAPGLVEGGGTFTGVAFEGPLTFSGITLADSSLSGDTSVLAGSRVGISGTITNTGTFTVAGGAPYAYTQLALAGDATLAGSGTTVLGSSASGYPAMVMSNGGTTPTLTIGNGHTLRGSGYLGQNDLNIVNKGTVIAEGATPLYLYPSATFDNSTGSIQVAQGATLQLLTGTLSGGSIAGLGTGGNLIGGGTFRDVALSGLLTVQAGQSANVSGLITNTGTLTIAGDNSYGYGRLYLAGDTTLAGSGTTVLGTSSYGYYSAIGNATGAATTLTIASGHTVRGSGYIGLNDLNIVNQGTVIAEGATPLYLYPSSTFDNTAGTLAVMADGALQLLSGTLLLGDASTLRFDVNTAASGAAEAGLFTLAGDVSFDGALALDLSDYQAQVGDSFTLLNFSGNGSGQFDSVLATGYSVAVHYNLHDVTVEVTGVSAVPEPSQWALMATGVLLMAGLMRRRKAAAAH